MASINGMKKTCLFIGACVAISCAMAQANSKSLVQRPKLVIGIVVDQMRWDYLYRYYDRYTAGGFKRMINEGFSCENAFINYIPSITAVGHSTIFTGSVPAIDGIAGNDWTDQLTGKYFYCTDDDSVNMLGATAANNRGMSPRNLLVTTITDELKIATNFRSKVVGISLKDRASILPAGHSADAAYWFDDSTGHFVTSTYYMKQLPDWVVKFNNKNRPAQLLEKGWNTLYPVNTYKASDPDNVNYEGKFVGETSPTFPHDMKTIYSKNKGSFRQTPFGSTLTFEFVKEAMEAYQLGKGQVTDFLTINVASTDHVGHLFGPNSIEIEDVYLRLDKDLADFFQLLDAKIGKGQWVAFLTADHGAAHSIGFMQQHNLPADYWYPGRILDSLNKMLSAKFNTTSLIRSITNFQVNFDLSKVTRDNLNFDAVKNATVDYLQRQPGILLAADMAFIGRYPIPERMREMMINGYYFKRSGQVQIILNAGSLDAYNRTGTGHGLWNPYDTHLPLLWYGWGVKQGKLNREVQLTDISATLAAMLHIQMPSGCIGHVIEEVIR